MFNLLCVYAPTLTVPDDTKDDFYNQLDTIIKGFPKQEDLVILGDYNLPSTMQWENVKNATLLATLGAFGKRKGSQQNDWYHANSARLDPFIEAKCPALQAYKDIPSPATLNTLRSARNDVQKEVRVCTNEYWTDLCRTIQQAADTGNVKGMYEGIKKATGPSIRKTAPLKSKSGEVITDKAKQLDRWVLQGKCSSPVCSRCN